MQLASNEATKLGKFLTVGEIGEILKLAQGVLRNETKSNSVCIDFLGDELLMTMAVLYHAGEVAGVRKERAKAKRTKREQRESN